MHIIRENARLKAAKHNSCTHVRFAVVQLHVLSKFYAVHYHRLSEPEPVGCISLSRGVSAHAQSTTLAKRLPPTETTQLTLCNDNENTSIYIKHTHSLIAHGVDNSQQRRTTHYLEEQIVRVLRRSQIFFRLFQS